MMVILFSKSSKFKSQLFPFWYSLICWRRRLRWTLVSFSRSVFQYSFQHPENDISLLSKQNIKYKHNIPFYNLIKTHIWDIITHHQHWDAVDAGTYESLLDIIKPHNTIQELAIQLKKIYYRFKQCKTFIINYRRGGQLPFMYYKQKNYSLE